MNSVLRGEEILRTCSEGLRLDPDDAELHFRKAVLHRKAGQPAEVEACWRRILTLKRPDQFCSVDQGIYGHLTLRNLAVLAEERGDRAEALRLWKLVLDTCPGDAEALLRCQASQSFEKIADWQRQGLGPCRRCVGVALDAPYAIQRGFRHMPPIPA
jgi:tetratricopeptide (TPR) repeat protein